MVNKAIEDLKASAERAASVARRMNENTPECKMAYARGVRAMASLVQACANVADEMCDNSDNKTAQTMLNGYANALRHIVRSADDLIPPGYEL